MMKGIVTAVLMTISLGFLNAEVTGAELLRKIDAQVSFDSDYAAILEIRQEKPQEPTSVTKVAVFRRDKERKYHLEVLSPDKDKGKKYLKVGETLWVYDPNAKRITSTNARERFQNSSARNSDFVRTPLADDYKIVKTATGTLGKWTVTIYDLEAIRPEVTYFKSRIWVTDDSLVRKTEDYSKEGQLLRTSAIPTYTKVGNRWDPARIVILDELRGKTVNGKLLHEQTEILVTRPNVAPQPDNLFSLAYLESMVKK